MSAVRFKSSPVPDCENGHVFVSWCEYHGMIGVSAPNHEELKSKVGHEVEQERAKYPHKYQKVRQLR